MIRNTILDYLMPWKERYAHGDYAKGYYKTLISAASYFALSEEAYDIF